MIVAKIREKGKFLLRKDIYTVLIVIFVGLASFGLGRLSFLEAQRPEVMITNAFPETAPVAGVTATEQGSAPLPASTQTQSEQLLVGSKNSDKYHFPWCSGAQRIKEENKVWFSSREDAQSRGYTPAANCEGL